MTPDELYADVIKQYGRAKYVAGLVIAEIDMLNELGVPGQGLKSLEEVSEKFGLITEEGDKKLRILKFAHNNVSLRACYDKVASFIRVENHRLDYPMAPGHATGAWDQRRDWLEALVQMSPAELDDLRKRVVALVLQLPSHELDPSTIRREPPLFEMVLSDFSIAPPAGSPKEPSGAVYQAITFGFVRADNPHLQVETRKVRTGSKRGGGIGDIDGWDGSRLALSAEVKQFKITDSHVKDLTPFSTEVAKRAAIGLVVSLGFDEEARKSILAMGLYPLDRDDLLNIVQLWDPVKQRIAISSMTYHVEHVEAKSAIMARFKSFIAAADKAGPIT